MRVERIPPPELAQLSGKDRADMQVLKLSPTFTVEGPLTERQSVETEWGIAWAEAGTYVLTNEHTDWPHIVHPDDFERQYQPVN